MRSASAKPAVMTSTVGSPLRSSSALVATVVPRRADRIRSEGIGAPAGTSSRWRMPATAGSAYRPGFSESSLCTASVPSGRRATTSVNVPPRSIQKSQPPASISLTARSIAGFRWQVAQRDPDRAVIWAGHLEGIDQRVHHVVPGFAQVEQALRSLPELRRIAVPQPVSERRVLVQVLAAYPPARMVMVGLKQDPPVIGVCRVERAQIRAAEDALEHAEREGSAGERPEVTIGQHPADQNAIEAERSGVPVQGCGSPPGVGHPVERPADKRDVQTPS